MRKPGAETRECPAEFQDRLTERFGVNIFGEPNLKIVWNQSLFHIIGNRWRDGSGNERMGYRQRYQGDGQPCWVIVRWRPADVYGTPDLFYSRTLDAETGMHFMGAYPWKGRYEIVQPLIRKEFVDNKLKISHFPICHFLIDILIPLLEHTRTMSIDDQIAARELAKQEDAKRQTEEIADKLAENLPTYWNPVSYSNQGCRTSLLTKKMDAIQAVWNKMSKSGVKLRKGFGVGNAN
jgi:hypothetical protein